MRLTAWLARVFADNPIGVLFAMVLLLGAAPFGAMHAALVPAGQAADEPAHAFRGYSVGHGEIVGHREVTKYPDGAELPVTTVDIDAMLGAVMLRNGAGNAHAISLDDLVVAGFSKWANMKSPAAIGPIGSYFPLFYLPAAAVMAVAQPLGLVPADAVQISRFLNLGCFLLLGVAALLAAQRGRAIFLCVLSVPMTVSLAASLNIDALLIATSVLGAALLTRDDAAPSAGRWPAKSWWAAAAALVGVALVKPPYLPMLGALLLPLPRRGAWRALGGAVGRRLGLVVALSLPVFAWTAYVARYVVSGVYKPAYTPGPWWPGEAGMTLHGTDAAAQTKILLDHPGHLLAVVQSGLHESLKLDMVGVLGWLDVMLPKWLYPFWWVAVGIAVASEMIGRRGAGRGLRLADTLLLLLMLAATVAAICVSQYLAWTPVGFTATEGVQGRYFLPLLPFLALVLPRAGIPGGGAARLAGLLAPGAAAIAGCVAMPFIFLWVYYLR